MHFRKKKKLQVHFVPYARVKNELDLASLACEEDVTLQRHENFPTIRPAGLIVGKFSCLCNVTLILVSL